MVKEKTKILQILAEVGKVKNYLLNKYRDTNEPFMLLDMRIDKNNENFLIVDESEFSEHLNEIDSCISRSLKRITSFERSRRIR